MKLLNRFSKITYLSEIVFTQTELQKNLLLRTVSTLMILMTFTNPLFAFQQQEGKIEIEGVVYDDAGMPLPGASVMEKNTTNGVQTDFDGKYTIAVDSESAILIFSYVGMKSQEIVVGGQTAIKVTLQNDLQSLDEVVLVGYGKQKKISVVGAQSTIEAKDLEQPVANIGTMLAGRVAGLTGVQRDGLPGYDGADIWIRGISTFGNSNPLILVDGVERSLDNLDPRDIASFSILKDASATAVYGIRGANGVILIETKRGEIGKPEVSIDYNEGFTFFTRLPDLANGETYMRLANEALTTRGQEPKYAEDYIQNTVNNEDQFLYPDVDWMDAVFKDYGRNRRASVNVTGGAEDALYYVSLGYYDETGLFITDGLESYNSDTRFKRYNFTSNLTLDITKTTKVNIGIQGYLSEGTYPGAGVGSVFSAAMEAPPVEYPILYPGGYVPGKSSNGGLRNPYADVARRGYQNENKNQMYSNLRVTQELSFLTKGLSWTGMFAFDTYNEQFINRSKRESTYFVDQNFPYTEDGALLLNETFTGQNFLGYGNSNGGNRRFYLETSFNYDRTFDKHRFGGLLLFNRTDYVDAFADNFTASIPYRNQGLAGRITYSYDDRYFVEVNAGYNGSENFAPSNRYGFFPSFAAGWIISNEDFFEPLSGVIDYLKIRYSDGKVGSATTNNDNDRFLYISRVEQNDDWGFDFGESPQFTTGIRETYYGVDVTWAEARKQDLGIELNVLDNSVQIIFDVFKEYTKGAFLQRGDLPNYIGLYSDPYGNLGIVENKGFDGSLNYRKSFGELNVGIRGNFSYNRNEIIENGQPQQLYEWQDKRGTPLLANFGYVAERLYTLEDDTDGDGFITPDDGPFPTQFGQIMPGDIKYEDLNNDGKIDSYDQKEIGQGDVPALTYGFGITADYKGFDISLFFQGQNEADRMIGGSGIQPFVGGGGTGNLYTVAEDRWTPENNNPHALYPRLSYGDTGLGQNNNTQGSTWWLREINFLRLKTAEIGYTLPKNISDKLSLGNTRFYVRGTNLFTISDFDLWDPELNTGNGGVYPNISVVSMGVNVLF
ncbi:SusC/RagA family TonB-linked outer membrane protein [Galbibacter pacificus]|uniref:TonB-dependent receptor n=1 Tax=Galbibacter pacificus TaxID=2996052 RepID=A0ABT6FTQ4_9FLAO|nr:TonB-dependent receptor [Galbibacter pacificus]MDG3583011.1 TonB-dependent receptor [Galbibacter pacificus]MDG3586492.1 TonB-dependent receptor [Galbibacter pacificus]